MRTYKCETCYGDYEIALTQTQYSADGALAVVAYEKRGLPFATLTVNLGEHLGPNEAFVDTNNCPWAEDFLMNNGLAEPTGRISSSGFCIYPAYKFHPEKF